MATRRIGELNLVGTDQSGVEWSVQKVDGWGATASTASFTQRARQSGAWSSVAFAANREVAINGTIIAPSTASASMAFDRLITAVSLSETPLTIDDGQGDRWCSVKQSGEVIPTWLNTCTVQYSIQVASTDWRKFGATVTGSTGLPSSSGGFTFPLSFPFNIPATVTSGQVSLTNPGNASGRVVLRIDGPVTGPVVTHTESGRVIALSPLLTVGAGEYLLIDPEAQTVLANGQAGRSMYLTSRQWFGFEPGGNTYTFSASSSNGDARLSVEAIESWR